jgi:hypothetical protein
MAMGQSKPNQGETKMDSTRSARHGQIEVEIIEHDGHEYAAFGKTIRGREITAYLKYKKNHFWLSTWAGGAILNCRSEVVERFWNGALPLMFRLPHNRFIVGYALGDDEMLFRGELIDNCTDDDARRHALQPSENWAELDAEDEAVFETELAEV